MRINMVGAFIRNDPFGTEIAFKKGLEQIGVEVRTWDPSRTPIQEANLSTADAVIIFKDQGESENALASLTAPVRIVYQPDDIRAPGIEDMMKNMLRFCEFAFTFDTSGAQVAEKLGYKKARRLLVTADPSIYRPLSMKPEWDFCFVGSYSNPQMHASRYQMRQVLHKAGFKVWMFDGVWDPHKINEIYNRSRVVLNHATDVGQPFGQGYGYQCRHFEAAMASSIFLSNKVLEGEGGPKNFLQFDSEESLVNLASAILTDWRSAFSYKKAFYEEVMTDHSPEVRAWEIVSFIEEVASGIQA